MTKHSATITVDTEDYKALRLLNNITKRAHKRIGRDTEFERVMRPIRKQLKVLQNKMEFALLDLETPLGKGKESLE